jgi:hypothetical protein
MTNKRNTRNWLNLAFLCCLVFCAAGCGSREDPLSQYDYRLTRQLVRLMQNAADQLETQGTNAFTIFRDAPDDWTFSDAYLYVYSTNGTCLFHAGMPELEGQALLDVEDASGRRSLQMALQAAADTNDPHGWVHYWWNLPNRLYPIWKSSCHQLVTLPDGQNVLLGAGLANLPRERDFVRNNVDAAARLLAEQGTNALELIDHPLSRFRLPGSPIFVVAEDGTALLSPSFQISQHQNILHYQDDAGHRPLLDALTRLEHTNRLWTILLVRTTDSMNLRKKGLYIRETRIGTNKVYAAATADLPEPAWMQ